MVENLDLFADLHAMTSTLRTERVLRLLRFTGLGPFTERPAGQLSGGMKQKLGLACALLSRPRLLLLDEPSVGVDPSSRRELWAIVSAMLEEGGADGMAVVWATAYLDEAARCGEVLLLHEGRLLAQGPPSAFVASLAGRVFRLSVPTGERRAASCAPCSGKPGGARRRGDRRCVAGRLAGGPCGTHCTRAWWRDARSGATTIRGWLHCSSGASSPSRLPLPSREGGGGRGHSLPTECHHRRRPCPPLRHLHRSGSWYLDSYLPIHKVEVDVYECVRCYYKWTNWFRLSRWQRFPTRTNSKEMLWLKKAYWQNGLVDAIPPKESALRPKIKFIVTELYPAEQAISIFFSS